MALIVAGRLSQNCYAAIQHLNAAQQKFSQTEKKRRSPDSADICLPRLIIYDYWAHSMSRVVVVVVVVIVDIDAQAVCDSSSTW